MMAGARAYKWAAMALLLTTTGACTEVIRFRVIDDEYPSRPAGCALDMWPGEKGPGYGMFTDVAYAEVRCRARARCIDELRRLACAAGARGVYWGSEETRDGRTEIDASFAVPVRPDPLDRPKLPAPLDRYLR